MYIVECITTTVGHHMDAMARHEYDYKRSDEASKQWAYCNQ